MFEHGNEGQGDLYEPSVPLPDMAMEFSVDWTTDGHTGAAVPVTAQGPGSSRFARMQRNTDIHDAILRAMGLPR